MMYILKKQIDRKISFYFFISVKSAEKFYQQSNLTKIDKKN